MSQEFGIIIIRHVNSEKTNLLWMESYSCARRVYPECKIIIIDDNSYTFFLKNEIELINCEIINSEFPPQRGELLPYYYLYKFKFFTNTLIIHDSVFLQKKIELNHEPIKYLWHFAHNWDEDEETIRLIEESSINHKQMIKTFYLRKDLWHGCFGVQSIININFLTHIFDKYNLNGLVTSIDSRKKRCNLERLFSVICTLEHYKLYKSPSLFGTIHNYIRWGYSFDEYQKNNNKSYFHLIKTWHGR